MREPEVCFNMDLANGRTGARFCYEACAVLEAEIPSEDLAALDAYDNGRDYDDFGPPDIEDIVQEWTDRLDAAGYYVRWDAGDVVVFDLRDWTDAEREELYAAEES